MCYTYFVSYSLSPKLICAHLLKILKKFRKGLIQMKKKIFIVVILFTVCLYAYFYFNVSKVSLEVKQNNDVLHGIIINSSSFDFLIPTVDYPQIERFSNDVWVPFRFERNIRGNYRHLPSGEAMKGFLDIPNGLNAGDELRWSQRVRTPFWRSDIVLVYEFTLVKFYE